MIREEIKTEQGRRLLECIKKKYKSQAEFASDYSSKAYYTLSASNLNAMIKGKRTITRDFAHAAAPLLDVSESFLLCESDSPVELPFYQFINGAYGNENNAFISMVVSFFENMSGYAIFFYVLNDVITPETIPLNDYIEMHRKDFPSINEECKDRKLRASHKKFILEQLYSTETMPANKEELSRCIELFEKSESEERKKIKYHNWDSVRRKCTLKNLSAFSEFTSKCFYHDSGSKSEVIIECVEFGNQIIPYCDFLSLANMGVCSFVNTFNLHNHLSQGQRLKNDLSEKIKSV